MPKSSLRIKSIHELLTYLETRKQMMVNQRMPERGFSYESGAIYALDEAIRAVLAYKEELEQEVLQRAKSSKTST